MYFRVLRNFYSVLLKEKDLKIEIYRPLKTHCGFDKGFDNFKYTVLYSKWEQQGYEFKN